MSFYEPNKEKNYPTSQWLRDIQEKISDVLNDVFSSETDDFITPELRLAAQKLEEADYWVGRSNCYLDAEFLKNLKKHTGK